MQKPIKKQISLKWSLTCIIAFCWILPILIMIGATSYFVFTNIQDRTASTIEYSVENAVRLSQGRIDSAIESARSATYNSTIKSSYEKFLNTGNRTERYDTVRSYLKQQYQQDEKFSAVGLYFIDDPSTVIFVANSLRPNAITSFKANTSEQMQKNAAIGGTDIAFFESDGNIYLVRNLVDKNYSPFAVMCLELNSNMLFSSIEGVAMSLDATVWLDDAEITLFGELPTDTMIMQTFDTADQGFVESEEGTLVFGTINANDYAFKYFIRADSAALLMQLSGFYKVVIGISISMLPLLLGVVAFFHYKINKPINSLIDAAQEIEHGNFGTKVGGNFRSAEFQYLAESFDRMSDTLKNQFERLYKEELSLRDAKIMALQLQINPHFLNNTLENINWEARMAGDDKVCKMLESLSVMLAATMDRKNQRIVHLSEEMMYVDAYLHIITQRLGNRLVVIKEIDEKLQEFYVPRLIMQPVIENAVEHGIQPTQKGTIVIRAYKLEDAIILEVENDGTMTLQDEENIERLLESEEQLPDSDLGNLGIRNVNQRLKIMYGKHSGLQIKMNKNQHTVAKIIIPINQQQQ